MMPVNFQAFDRSSGYLPWCNQPSESSRQTAAPQDEKETQCVYYTSLVIILRTKFLRLGSPQKKQVMLEHH